MSATNPELVRKAILAIRSMEAKLQAAEEKVNEPIAIIGMGCRFPGGADHPEAFWNLIKAGFDGVSDVPADRWNAAEYYDADPASGGKIYSKYGCFLDDVDKFDARFFNISAREAESLDPQQRLLLDVSWKALENAAIAPDALNGSDTGVFIGITTNDYSHQIVEGGQPDRVDAYFNTGNALNAAAGRISYTFGFSGPSMVIDTACSSSLVAIHQACLSLRNGDCTHALAGGVSLLLSPLTSVGMSRMNMLSPDGRCKSFDDRANGIVRGEGCAVILLKKLSDAINDKDNIWGIIKGSAVNQDGASGGLTVPNGKAQERLIEKALSAAHVNPADVSVVETHGTGTPLGDPIEVHALSSVYGKGRAIEQPLLLGALKTNIGHLEACAGVAGVIKTVLAMKHRLIPAPLHFNTPNSRIAWDDLLVTVPRANQVWDSPAGKKRLAGVSSFGFSGTNAHLIIEEPSAPEQAEPGVDPGIHVLTISAKTPEALDKLVQKYETLVSSTPEETIGSLCYTANTTRNHFEYRLAVMAANRQALVEALGNQPLLKQNRTRVVKGALQKTAFLCTGQGSQYARMGKDLYETQPVFRKTLDYCSALFEKLQGESLIDLLYKAEHQEKLNQTQYTQPALFSVGYALAEFWKSLGIRPSILIGHSVGEYTAACIAGVFSLEEGMRLITERGRLMQSLPPGGGMAALFASREEVSAVIAPYGDKVAIAAINGPALTVVSGYEDVVEQIVETFSRKGVRTSRLLVSHAFHSPLLLPIVDAFRAVASTVQYNKPQIKIISNSTGKVADSAISTAEYWCKHLLEPVNFYAGVQTLQQEQIKIHLEIGPTPSLTAMIRSYAADEDKVWLYSLHPKNPDWTCVLDTVSQLYLKGIDIDWQAVYEPFRLHKVALPAYPFQAERHWFAKPRKQNEGNSGPDQGVAGGSDDLMSKSTQEISTHSFSSPITMAQQKAESLATLKTILGEILHEKPESLDIHMPFLEMGADSIVLVEALKKIENTFAVQLKISQLFQELSTLDSLSEYVVASQPVNQPANEVPQSTTLTPSTNSAPVSYITSPVTPQLSGHSVPEGPATHSLQGVLMKQLEVLQQTMAAQLQLMNAVPAQVSQNSSAPAVPATTAVQQPLPGRVRVNSNQISAAESTSKFNAIRLQEDRALTPLQQHYLDELIKRYTTKTSQSKTYAQQYRHVLADWINSLGFRLAIKEMIYQIVSVRSAGSRFWDLNGNEYVDLAIGFGVNFFGNSPEFVKKAVSAQLEEGFELAIQSDLAGEVASLISELTGFERVAFCNTGTDAVMNALRIARTATQKQKVVLFKGFYHGTFDGYLAEAVQDGESIYSKPVAPGTTPGMIEDVIPLNYGSEESLKYIIEHADELAAVLVEPVQSRRPGFFPKEFLIKVREITEQYGITLILDEIITGFRSHTGGVQAMLGIKADITTYGKIVGGGMPIGVIAAKPKYLNAVDGGWWQYGDASYPETQMTLFGGTFCKHPLALAAAKAVLLKLKTEGQALHDRVNNRTDRLAQEVNEFFDRMNVAIRIVHFGSLFRFEPFGKYNPLLQPIELDIFFFSLINKGVYTWERRINFLSVAHSDEDVSFIIAKIKEVISDMIAGGFFPEATKQLKTNAINGSVKVNGHAIAHQTAGVQAGTRNQPEPALPGIHMLPVTDAQKHLWVLTHLSEEGGAAYNVPVTIRLKGQLDRQSLSQALQLIVDRHDALRTTFTADGTQQTIHRSMPVTIHCSRITDAGSAEEVEGWHKTNNGHFFDFVKGPLFKAALLTISDDEHLFTFVAHHIIYDGWSAGVLSAELGNLYSKLTSGASIDESPVTQFSERSARPAAVPDAEATSYWLDVYGHPLALLELPLDKARPAMKTYRAESSQLTLQHDLADTVKLTAKRSGLTPFMMLFGGYALLLHKLTGQNDVVIGIPVAGRDLEKESKSIGYYAQVLPIRVRIDRSQTTKAFLTYVRNVVLQAFDNSAFTLTDLLDRLHRQGDATSTPVVSTLFNVNPGNLVLPKLEGLESSVIDKKIWFTPYELLWDITENDGGYSIDCDYNTDLFAGSSIKRFCQYYEQILTGLCTDATLPIRQLDYLPLSEKNRLNSYNDTSRSYDKSLVIQEFIEKQVKLTPHAVAVVDGERTLSYEEVNRKANQLARYLRTQHGLSPGSFGSILLNRSSDLLIAIVAVLKSGAAYVPIDPRYPAERIEYICKDSKAAVLITESKLASLVSGDCQAVVIPIDTKAAAINECADENLAIINQPADVAYLIYTSGSTGKPKGVMIRHLNTAAFFNWAQEEFKTSDYEVVYAASSICFDLSVFELLFTLTTGKCVRMLQSALDIKKYIGQDRKVLLNTVPSVVETLQKEKVDLATVTVINLAGEPLPERIVKSLDCQRIEVRNLYGPSEDTTYSTFYRLKGDESIIPIGIPIANSKAYILDDDLNLVPHNVIGEICLSGDGVAAGYLNNSGLTAQKFIDNPFEPGTVLYRTGDLGRWMNDGTIEFRGRNDYQVKLRGFRIELGEIEKTLEKHEEVVKAIVVVSTVGQTEFLAAYYTADRKLEAEGLKRFLECSLPGYMVPSFIIQLKEWPMSGNGKIDRKALPAPQATAGKAKEIVLPDGKIEQILLELWKDVLGTNAISVTDNFFEIGGHSLKASQLLFKIQESLITKIEFKTLFEQPTIRSLGHYLKEAGNHKRVEPLPHAPERVSYPLSAPQKRLWMFSQIHSDHNVYNMPGAFKVLGKLEVEALKEAFNELIDRHEILHTTFHFLQGEPQQIIQPVDASTVDFTVQDVSQQSEPLLWAQQLMQADAITPFDLVAGPLIRMKVFTLSSAESLVYVNMHHIIADGWSVNVILSDILSLYIAKVEGKEAAMPRLTNQYKDFAYWHYHRFYELANASKVYWTQKLSGDLPVLELPSDFTRPAAKTYQGKTIHLQLDGQVTVQLSAYSVDQKATLFMTLLAAVNTLLHHYTGQEDILVGTALAGREHPDLQSQVGFYVNTLPLRTTFSASQPFNAMLAQVKQSVIEAIDYQIYSAEDIVEWLPQGQETANSSLFNVMVSYNESWLGTQNSALTLNASDDGSSNPIEVELYPLSSSTSKYDFSFEFTKNSDGLLIGIEYSSDLYSEARMQRMMQHFVNVVNAIVASSNQPVGEIGLLTDQEKHQIIHQFNNTQTSYPRDETIARLFEHQVMQTPEAQALVFNNQRFTYKKLDQKANQLAHYLRDSHRVQPGDRVGVVTGRSSDTIVAFLAILKCGAVYVPMDETVPVNSLQFVGRDTALKVVLFNELTADQASVWENIPTVNLSSVGPELAACADSTVSVAGQPGDVAYIMYTSGSTGQPKGVLVTHRNVVRLVKNTNYISIQSDERLLLTGAISFDATTFEIWGMLLNGGCVYVSSHNELMDTRVLKRNLLQNRISTVWFTASWFNQLVDLDLELFGGLKNLLIGGDKLSPRHVNMVKTAYPELRIINGYGPTENTTFSICHPIDEYYTADIPLGRPIANSKAYIINRHQKLCPIGIQGEICLAGDGLALGYLNQPELTAGKFVTIAELPGELVYRTGDLGRWLENGDVAFMGRNDFQMKIKGFRIEAGEIEGVLLQHPGLEKVIVTAIPGEDGSKELVAYYTATVPIEEKALAMYLKSRVPHYMIPAYWIRINEVPLTANGKADLRSLPVPAKNGTETLIPQEADQTPMEGTLASLWKEVLGKETIRVTDNFFDVGGHSLKAMRLLAKINGNLSQSFDLKTLYQYPVLTDMARQIESVAGQSERLAIEPLAQRDFYALSYPQESMWTAIQFDAQPAAYNIAGAYLIKGDIDHQAYCKAFEEITNRHESLRTNIVLVDDEPRQQIQATASSQVTLTDMRSRAEPYAEAMEAIKGLANQCFNLESDPLIVSHLFRIADRETIVLMNIHHIIADGWSLDTILSELLLVYKSLIDRQKCPLQPLALQYKDYAAWQRNHLTGERLQQLVYYWKNRLGRNHPVLALPADFDNLSLAMSSASFEFVVSKELTAQLETLAKKHNTTLYSILLTAYTVVLHGITKQPELIVGTSVAGRAGMDLQTMVGYFVCVVPIKCSVHTQLSFAQQLKKTSHDFTADLFHAELPFDQLVREVQPERIPGKTPLFQTRFIYNDFESSVASLNTQLNGGNTGLELSNISLPSLGAKYEIDIRLTREGDTLAGQIEYRSDLFKPSTIEKLHNQYLSLLDAVTERPDLPIHELLAPIVNRDVKKKQVAALTKLKSIPSIGML
ncbi:non-ribosomal peptide synthetase/type I polyketide synthase [Spirosoma utsteinense]|uniref:Amino acid adenylation domain-containing protein n=1 Tax=Spirosoma utsteinense TaxID=2585773 RepID=A0ABR6W9B4_9BACT|nr:non-ribosomal peptide synthetase/type I polyketide synthase [Spirosoma utsteinense]MBC3787161.1 amino acid adenylation domain-containing protein [Spirosoma utsteinense]MBC3792844.1 amino acid adenylation domain-containing protein [Spirosoma utsteinense]